ncbi:Guanine nucleotide exchange factor in Golgi transport N terminal Sec7 domain [Trypanosoma vivax]|uniref:SEC7 domain-containing protein n=1 Tax=Trypanosoma vivax (strain Y486) TaxID=1055687 RepID=G0U9B0_TRYVY|nr:hypothetical protein TRVL_01401 [Trypanosoma vivax]KAH8605127.1 Guanine nucleotide exchange factor in Golgi transport N terminal Sec7 domain [Trypanosoma vivax]CCC54195.1 conserved hypothetical protein [Trypanosoma vivax Y486]
MESLMRALDSLLKLIGRGDVSLDTEFKQALRCAEGCVAKSLACVARGHQPTVTDIPVVSVILSALYLKKNRIVDAVLPVLLQLVQSGLIPYDKEVILYQAQGNSNVMVCGCALFQTLCDFLTRTTDPSAQLTGVEILHDLVSNDGCSSFTGKCVTRCVQVCCQVALQSANEGARAISRDLIPLCVFRVTRAFAESAPSSDRPCTFASSTLMDDCVSDVEPDAKYTPIVVHDIASSLRASTAGSLSDTLASQQDGELTTEELSASKGPFQPLDYFRSSLNEHMIQSALLSMKEKGRFPDPMKDLLLLIKHTCKLGTRSPSASSSTNEANLEIRARQLALEILEKIFQALPEANCNFEHNCATWLSLVLAATKYDLIHCIARNISTVVPASFFTTCVRILTLIMRKCHYHIARELHTLLAVMVFPLALSKYSSFHQKHAVLNMVRELLNIPHLCISYFINYDCNPAFDASGKYGGMLEMLVRFVARIMLADHVDTEWLSVDQLQLLRGDCVRAIHSVMQSMQRWIAEDPKDYSHQQTREYAGQTIRRLDGIGKDSSQWHEVYHDCWGVSDRGQHRASADRSSSNAVFSMGAKNELGSGPLRAKKRGSVGYHWKHIHFLLHGKRTAQAALRLINTGKWRDGMSLLQRRGYIPPEGDDKTWPAFARFLKTYSGVERSALCGIFERVIQKEDCDRVLREYLQLFSYRNVPIDIALRDTTCEFMSWDRPTFEAQVWGMIQQRFGEVYAMHNPHSITPEDANAMAGVLLFLHTSLHNANARTSRMTMKDFVRNGNECVSVPFPEDVMRDMYNRIAQRKWELDEFQRTPRQIEKDLTAPSFATMVNLYHQQQQQQEQQLSMSANGCDETVNDILTSNQHFVQSTWASEGAEQPKGESNASDISSDTFLLDAQLLPYSTQPEGFKLRELYHQRYVELSIKHLHRLEQEHRWLQIEPGVFQPYIVPHYAQHVRPMLLMLYPTIAAAAYMGFRVQDGQPILRLLHDTYRILFDVAAALQLSLVGMQTEVVQEIERCMLEEGSKELPPPGRAAFVLPLMSLV